MTSESHQKAQAEFKEFCDTREIHNFDSVVQVIHQDGSIFVLHHACVWYSREYHNAGMPLGDHMVPSWIGVATEHNGNHLFHGGDLLDWWIK